MDYENSFIEFENVVSGFVYNLDMQLVFIIEKIKHFMRSYEEEKTDNGRKVCLEYIGKLNDMYVDYLIEQSCFILGVFRAAGLEEISIKANKLLDKKKDQKSFNEIKKAYDFLQCFKI